ncbi:MAG: HD-GYP domain-containing protein [Negativicutes bacterium]|nr:HD-GYP domain-containing protein [Negativicutes bacterium]
MKGSRTYSFHDLKPGMVLARAVFSDDGRTVIGERAVLTKHKISRLGGWSVSSAEIMDSDGQKEPGYRRFEGIHQAMAKRLADTFEKARFFKTLAITEINELVEQTQKVIASGAGVLGYLAMLQKADDYVFGHSLNVGMIAGLIGKWAGYGGAMLQELILAGFLHDIGKTQIPLPILNKPGKLDPCEWKVMRQHPMLGSELLRSVNPLADGVLSGVDQHHERMDRSGYPRGLAGCEITSGAKIIAIADIYDAVTSDRTYRAAQTPFQAIEEVGSQMFDKLDPRLCNIFIAKAQQAFIGVEVRLSDGSEATVVAMDQTTMAKPIVRKKTGCFINLAHRNDVTIIAMNPGKADTG